MELLLGGLGYRVQGLGFRGQGLGFFGFRVLGGLGVLGLRALGFSFGGLGLRVAGLQGFNFQGLRFRGLGSGGWLGVRRNPEFNLSGALLSLLLSTWLFLMFSCLFFWWGGVLQNCL